MNLFVKIRVIRGQNIKKIPQTTCKLKNNLYLYAQI